MNSLPFTVSSLLDKKKSTISKQNAAKMTNINAKTDNITVMTIRLAISAYTNLDKKIITLEVNDKISLQLGIILVLKTSETFVL